MSIAIDILDLSTVFHKYENSFLYSIRLSQHWLDYGDTITANDLVTRQYENLPYPEVNENELLKEEEYYRKEHDNPLLVYPSHLLEKVNYYLYQGNENFRYVKIFSIVVCFVKIIMKNK